MYEYLIKHKYLSNTDNRIFHSRHGWDDYVLQKNLVYSFRDDTYDAVNRFDENIHAIPITSSFCTSTAAWSSSPASTSSRHRPSRSSGSNRA